MSRMTHLEAPARVRLDFLDAIRFAAMVLMVQGHTLDALVRPDQLDVSQSPWWIWHALRGLTAPMFLLLSGLVGTLTLRREPDGRVVASRLRRRALWGFGLIVLGYFLVFPANRLADLRWLSPEVWRGFLQVNILQLNGLCLLLTTLLAALTRSDRTYGLLAFGAAVLLLLGAPAVQAVPWFDLLPEGLAAYLSPAHGSLFPLFPHGAFLFLGAGLGWLLKGLDPAVAGSRFLKLCGLGALGALALAPLVKGMPLVPAGDPFGVNPGFTFVRLTLTLLLMLGLGWVALRLPRVTAAVAPLGGQSLRVYVGHLLLLYGLPWVHGMAQGRYRTQSLAEGMGSVFLVWTVTFGGVLLLELLQKKAEPLHRALRISSAGLLAWALLF